MRNRPHSLGVSGLALVVAAGALAACADSAGLATPVERPDAGAPPNTVPGVLRHMREDFINQQLVGEVDGVLIDVNQGLVTLPTEALPEIRGEMVRSFTGAIDENGMVSAAQIIIQEQAVLRASDSIALVASELLRVTGEIHAGKGGVLLAAGKQLIIDGTIESEGPIRLSIGREDGTIEVRGRVTAVATSEGLAPGVEVLGRGALTIDGSLRTQAQGAATSGDIRADLYGPITIADWAEVTTEATSDGTSGSIRLKSEADLALGSGARAGAAAGGLDPGLALFGQAGDVELEAERIKIGARAVLVAGSSALERGGSVRLTAGESLRLGDGAFVVAGAGPAGGAVVVATGELHLGPGAGLRAGRGLQLPGELRVDASGAVTLEPSAEVRGADGVCVAGGAAVLRVGGPLELGPDTKVSGGDADVYVDGRTCPPQLHKGGDVEVTARSIMGDTDLSITGGSGSVRGTRRLVIDPAFEVAPPSLTVVTEGTIESKTIDRGDDAFGLWPHLVALQSTTPAGTSVRLELGALAGPDATEVKRWIDLDANLSELADERWFRYRVTLEGRAFDTPVLDYFDIDLAPGK